MTTEISFSPSFADSSANSECADLANTVKQLTERMRSLEVAQQQRSRGLDLDLANTVKQLTERMQSLEVAQQQRSGGLDLGTVPELIAFSARLSHDVADLGSSQTIVFDQVITNNRNRYNNKTGVFYCDMPGTYVFNIHILANPGKWVQVELVRNGANYAHVYAFDDHHYDTGSNSVILDLANGDSAWVRAYGTSHSSGNVLDHIFATFSGFLLYPQ